MENLTEIQQQKYLFIVDSWCHVMEHESFENEDIANIMNASFINIKGTRFLVV
jgi:hypothetical protein